MNRKARMWSELAALAVATGGFLTWAYMPSETSVTVVAIPERVSEQDVIIEARAFSFWFHALFIAAVAGLVALPTDTIVRLTNAAGLANWKPAAQSIEEAINSVTPQPQNAMERMTNSAVRSLGGPAGGMGIGRAIGGGIGSVLTAAPAEQAAGAITGGASSQLAAEAGAGPVGQLVAGGGGVAGAGGMRAGLAEAARRSVRGGEAGRRVVEQNLADFQRVAGRAPSMGQATQKQAAESLLSRAPGSAGVMAREGAKLADDVGSGVGRIASRLSPKSSAEQAGRAVRQGAQEFVRYVREGDEQLYSLVDQYMPARTPVAIPQTQRYLQQVTAPIAGAPNTSAMLANNRLSQIAGALGDDLAAAQSGRLPYQAVRALRTRVGEAIQNKALVNDLPTGQLRRLYGMLSDDLQRAAQESKRVGVAPAGSRA